MNIRIVRVIKKNWGLLVLSGCYKRREKKLKFNEETKIMEFTRRLGQWNALEKTNWGFLVLSGCYNYDY